MSYNAELQSNNDELLAILNAVNSLPDGGGGYIFTGIYTENEDGEYAVTLDDNYSWDKLWDAIYSNKCVVCVLWDEYGEYSKIFRLGYDGTTEGYVVFYAIEEGFTLYQMYISESGEPSLYYHGTVFTQADVSTIMPEDIGAADAFDVLEVEKGGTGVTSLEELATALGVGSGGGAQIQSGSYVGTGTYGASNPCQITFDFAPTFVIMLGYKTGGGSVDKCSDFRIMHSSLLTTSYVKNAGFGYSNIASSKIFGKKSTNGKTFFWYTTDTDSTYWAQYNVKDYEYFWVAIR